MSVPKYQRVAEQLTRLIEERWRIKAIVLDVFANPSYPTSCAVIEVRTPSWQFALDQFELVRPDDVSPSSLCDSERKSIRAILAKDNADRGPFSQLGWVNEARQWIQDELPDQNDRLRDEVQQLNAGGRFTLSRFITGEGCAYWLKAVGEPNTHEFSITRALSKYFPDSLPKLIATREDWNAWVMEEVGVPLRDCLSQPTLEQAVVALAHLQMQSADHVESLLQAGCADQRIAVIEAHLEELISYLEEVMAYQVSTKVPRLENHQLREIQASLRHACAVVLEQEIPDCLIHIDVNLGNILIDGSRCVFIDWAEAYIGNPFFTFEHLWANLIRDNKQVEAWAPHFSRLYKQQWFALIPERRIDQVLGYTPLLAIAAHLYGRGEWLHSERRNDPNFQGYTRSLARLMHRAAQAPELQEALCL